MQEPSTSSGGTLSLYVGGKLMTSNEPAGVGTATKNWSATVVGGCIDGNHTTGSKKNNNRLRGPVQPAGHPAPA